MNHRANHRILVFSFVIIVVALGVVTPVLADYIGPNRTVTETVNVCHVALKECQYVEDKDEWRYKQVSTWSCSNESKPWQEYSNNARPCNDTLHTNGYQYWERNESTRTETNTYPPATINSSLKNCTLQNGWCITAPHLSINGGEPVAGHSIFAIEGSLNGQTFGCMSSSCNVPLSQGNNSFSYWALSSFGDSSPMGTFTAKVDSQLPIVAGTFSGTAGSNGWYISPVSFNGSASDATSGLVSFTCSLDGIPLGSCNTIAVNNDGLHTLVLTAQDNAGHTRIITQNTSIDTQNPELNTSISGTLGSNNWYTDALLSATALDPSPGSGLSLFEYRLDESGWAAFPASGTLHLMDGNHTVELRAVDQAGRMVSSTKSFSLDRTAPAIALDTSGTIGLNDWYTTSLVLAAVSFDATSGVDVFDYSLDGNEWQKYTTALTLDDGIHNISLWAQDTAGHVTQIDHTYQIDTRLPQIAGSLSGTPGMNGWYISQVTLSASASDPLPASGVEIFTYTLNGSPETPYIDPLLLADGQHTVQFVAMDKAGLSHSTEQTIKVDTIQPSLQITTIPPAWAKGAITLSGTAGDDGSGLSKVEISTDGGQTWLNTTSAESNTWSYIWNTLESTDGVHQVTIRAMDLAGLATQQTFNVGVDNSAPEIILPASWFQWDTVTLDILDHHSGLSEVSVEISDPKARWPKRVIQLDPNQFPLKFKWDRRFGDNALAEPGAYEVSVIAYDKLGNTTTQKAAIKILVDILPAGPTSTPYVRANPTNTATAALPTAMITTSPMATQTAIVSVFGVIEPTKSVTPTPHILPTPRTTPTTTTVLDWLQSFFVPDTNQESVTELELSEGSTETPQTAGMDNSGVLWGTAATAAIAAATAYVQEEKRKREEEEALQAELEAKEEERREKKKERKIKKMEEKRAQEEAWEEARIEQETLEAFEGLAASGRYKDKLTDWEMQEEAIWEASQAEIRQKYEDKKKAEEKKKLQELQEGLEAYYNGRKEGEKETPKPEPNWWEKTKSFVNEKIVAPVDTYFYQPIAKPIVDVCNKIDMSVDAWLDKNVYEPRIQPFVERTKEFIKEELAWIDEHIYQPGIKPIGEKINDVITKSATWTNETIYQPYMKPVVDKVTQTVSNGINQLNEKVYQPYIQPVVKLIDEKVYQPYVKPVVEKVTEKLTDTASWLDTTIYQPLLAPVVNDINQYIYQPLATKLDHQWDEYGEWVHGALDAAGFIPGFGEIADGINGLIYLAEGRYLEASLSAISMIPIIGDAGKAVKWVDTAVSAVAGEAIEKAAKELLEEGVEKTAKESVEWAHTALDVAGLIPGASTTTTKLDSLLYLAEGRWIDATVTTLSTVPVVGDVLTIGREIIENSWDRLVKAATEEMQEKTVTETLDLGSQIIAKEAKEEAVEKITKETIEEGTEKVLKEAGEEIAEKTTKDVVEEAIELTVSKVQKELKEDAFVEKVTKDDTDTSITKIDEELDVEKPIKNSQDHVDETQYITSLKEQYGDEMVDTFLPFCEKYDINPYEVFSGPPAEGQSLIGWGLGIENPSNPANHPLMELRLTKDELNKILEESIVRSDSNVVVLGYGKGAETPYYILSDEIGGCHLSLSDEAWSPFTDAQANFLVDINIPFIEKGIEERKLFLFNIDTKVIEDPANIRRFSLPELQLLKMEKNDYVQVSIGEYSAFVPSEKLDTYIDDLPAKLLEKLGE